MSLITCEECDAQISDTAISCPKCGSIKHRTGTVNNTDSKKVATAPNTRLTVLLMVAGLLALTWFIPDYKPVDTFTDRWNDDLISASKKAVIKDLKDPESAQFRNVRIKDHQVCGEVNAKNALGGYTGFERFSYSKTFGLSMISGTSTECL